MEKHKFKTLMYGHIFVDTALLNNGIYESPKPRIFLPTETIENIAKEINIMTKIMDNPPAFSNYITNLKQCELVDIEITILKS